MPGLPLPPPLLLLSLCAHLDSPPIGLVIICCPSAPAGHPADKMAPSSKEAAIGIDLGTCFRSAAPSCVLPPHQAHSRLFCPIHVCLPPVFLLSPFTCARFHLPCSCVGVWRDGGVQIIENDSGSRTTPSMVAFTDEERLVGEAARNQAAQNPVNTVFDAKRLIGMRFSGAPPRRLAPGARVPAAWRPAWLGLLAGWAAAGAGPQLPWLAPPVTTCPPPVPARCADPSVQGDIEHFPFKVVKADGDKPSIQGGPREVPTWRLQPRWHCLHCPRRQLAPSPGFVPHHTAALRNVPPRCAAHVPQ